LQVLVTALDATLPPALTVAAGELQVNQVTAIEDLRYVVGASVPRAAVER
jgi:hypothetical protein